MVVNFYSFYIFIVVKGENLNPSPRLAAIGASTFNNIVIRVIKIFGVKSINCAKVRITAIRTLHKLLILLNKFFFELLVNIAPHNFRAELRAVASNESIGVITYILKRNDIIIICEESFKRNTRTLDGGVDAEEAIHEVIGSYDVNAHYKVPFRFFLYIVYHGVGYLSS